MFQYFYDVETFPNLFSVTFLTLNEDKSYQFVVHDSRDERGELRDFLASAELLIGFNSLNYDDLMLIAFLRNLRTNDLTTSLHELSYRIISQGCDDEEIREIMHADRRWKSLDLMKVMAFDKLGVSLKQTAINLRWPRIQDLPYSYDHRVTTDEIATILEYNLNDVRITAALYKAIKPQLDLRRDVSSLYGVDVMNASDSRMANLILAKIYADKTGADMKEIEKLRTRRDTVALKDCIASNIRFRTDTLKKLHAELLDTVVNRDNGYGYKKKVVFNGIVYQLGIGGLHSEDEPGKFFTDNEFVIRDADVSSYYPNIMLNNGIKPAHLGDEFLRILRQMTADRLAAKHSGDKVRADALKITINSIFGKLGSSTFWLEDARAMLSVTVSGQLYLLMLIEALALGGMQNISANTDGVVSKIERGKLELYDKICDWWQRQTCFELEYTDYEAYYRADVNNYITKKHNGKTKEKGRFLRTVDLKKGYRHPITAKAICAYFIDGIPVETTLRESTDILDFCISQKAAGKFQMELMTIHGNEVLQKNNRFYISNGGAALVKRNKETRKTTGLHVGYNVRILNDFDPLAPFDEYDINYGWYEKECAKIIDAIEPKTIQMSLFS